jgi:predicted ATPase
MEDLSLIAEMHSLPTGDLVPLLDLAPQRKKEKTFEALLRQVKNLSRQRPVLMLFEDTHWIDPGSREFLDRTIERISGWPVLLLATFRPEFEPPWIGQPHVTLLTLTRLGQHDTAAMLANLIGNMALPPETMKEIAERSDGVPLFVEELTKAVLESVEQAPAASIAPHPALSVPATLHASLMARLDRLGPDARDVARTGSAIGREFAYELLAPTTDLPEPDLHAALDRLTNAGLLLVRGTPPQATYIFKHALVQDSAYGTLLRGRRQRLHRRIAASLEDRFPETVLVQPALLAQHFEAAGLVEQAIDYWLKASQQALARSAMAEAIARSRRGLAILAGLPDGRQRQQRELDLLITLRPALAALEGFAAREAGEALSRGRELAERLDQPEHEVSLIWGQWSFHGTRGEHKLALALAERLEEIGTKRSDAATQLLGRLICGASHLFLGDLVVSRELLERCLGLGEPALRSIRSVPTDPYIAVLTHLAMTLAHLGYIDQAQSRLDEALLEARTHTQAPTLLHVLLCAIFLHSATRSPLTHVAEFLTLSAEHGFQHYSGWALIHRGRALVAVGKAREGLTLITRGLAELRPAGAVTGPQPLIWLCEAYVALGQHNDAQNCLAEAVRFVEATDGRLGEAEFLHRVPGDLLNAVGDRSGAEQHYRQAISVAERQSARLSQLRASTSLARLWRDQGKRAQARDLLGPIYNWFTEGLHAPDLKDAKALLDELA